ncbi:MAG: ABC transporter ATP-binding protein [Omnitrophica bacterium]|nr:ABC transporter ATP-binding protein [Candidatus Omnitrophota bacterium]
MAKPIIEVENLSKLYRLGLIGATTFRDSVERWWCRMWGKEEKCSRVGKKKLVISDGDFQAGPEPNTIWALKDVSFSVQQGEIIGIIGKNGAGKSTLLKILSRITEPTSGRAILRGRTSSLLEVGTGFHPELTGGENIYLNGAILGMRKSEIDRKFDEIVAFAEIEKFIETPVKRYSSGMYVRLAFAVAAHLEPEILLVDEVLAVGDVTFQKKCLGKMGEVAKQGRTVLFVSHNMIAVNHLCQHGIWLDKGKVQIRGEINDVVAAYLSKGAMKGGQRRWRNLEEAPGNENIRLCTVEILNSENKISSSLDRRYDFFVKIEYDIFYSLVGLRMGFALLNAEGVVIFSPNDAEDIAWHGRKREPGKYMSICTVPGGMLNSGAYTITIGADIVPGGAMLWEDNVLRFEIEQTGGLQSRAPDRLAGVICPSLEWHIDKLK